MPCEAAPRDAAPCGAAPCGVSPSDTAPCDAALCGVAPCGVSPCDAAPCGAAPCNVTLCDAVLHNGASRMQHGISAWRANQLELLRSVAESPGPMQMSAQIMAMAPPHMRWAVGPHAHPALIMAFIDALDWPDKHFAYTGPTGIRGGLPWPVVGWPADTELCRHRPVKDMADDARDYVHPGMLARTNSCSNAKLAASMQPGFGMAKQHADSARLAAYTATHHSERFKKIWSPLFTFG